MSNLFYDCRKDIIDHTKPNETIILEQLSWAEGGPVKFRHSMVQQKIGHTAKKHGRRVKKVKAHYSSHECPICHKHLTPDKNRVSKCASHWEADRDYTSAIILTQRATPTPPTPGKGKPTPKRPKPKKRLIIFTKPQRGSYTGLHPTIPTDIQKNVASIVGKEGDPLPLRYRKLLD